MRILDELRRAVEILSEYPGRWAICGGVASSVYRTKPRFTDDIDFAIAESPELPAKDLAVKVVERLGFKAAFGFIRDRSNPEKQALGLVIARSTDDQRFMGFDFLLPVQFWINSAVELAQRNTLDYGFARLPTVTPESLILAKIAAFSTSPERLQDLDDIQEIVRSVPVDLDYIRGEAAKYELLIPGEVTKLLRRDQE